MRVRHPLVTRAFKRSLVHPPPRVESKGQDQRPLVWAKNGYAAETMLAKSEIHKEALHLPAHERIELVVELWDSLAPTEIPIPDWQRDLIRERLVSLDDLRPDERSTPWEAARQRIFSDKA